MRPDTTTKRRTRAGRSTPRSRPARRATGDSLQHRLYCQLERGPERRAIAFLGPRGTVAWRSWRQFLEAASGYSRWLAEQGLGRGQVCALALQSDEACATALMGTLLLGAVPLLVAPPMLQEGSTHLLEVLTRTCRRAGARVAVVSESTAALREGLAPAGRGTRFVFLPEGGAAPAPAPVSRVAPAAQGVAAMQLTSGTTGFPRICVWKHAGVLAALDGMRAAMRLSTEDVCFNWTPLYHDMGLVNNFFLCLTSGVPVVMARPQDFIRQPALWLRGLWQTGSTVTWSPNFGFAVAVHRIRDEDVDGVRLDGVRAFYNAAERIHLETMQSFHKRFAALGVRPDALKTNFGCAENVGGATFSSADGPFVHERVDRALLYEQGVARPAQDPDERRSVSVVGVGRPTPGMRIAILSAAGRPLPEGHVGQIALETPSRMAGYLHQAAETRRALYKKWLRSGDLGYLRGDELFWVGRARERITVRGRKFDPSEVERVLFGIPGLRQGCFAAFGVADAELGTERLVVVSEIQESAAARADQITEQIRESVSLQLGLGADEVMLVKAGTLTKTSSGKRRHRFFSRAYLDGRLDAFKVPVTGGTR
ncbi:MAG: AMP-binding protein [Candidatus Rokubacteria bacterium]|nr:AMP-binding protein [Candidatus Rokubacteria bacterium]